jgi:hypothetical protein
MADPLCEERTGGAKDTGKSARLASRIVFDAGACLLQTPAHFSIGTLFVQSCCWRATHGGTPTEIVLSNHTHLQAQRGCGKQPHTCARPKRSSLATTPCAHPNGSFLATTYMCTPKEIVLSNRHLSDAQPKIGRLGIFYHRFFVDGVGVGRLVAAPAAGAM